MRHLANKCKTTKDIALADSIIAKHNNVLKKSADESCTGFLLSDPNNARWIREGIKQIEQGRVYNEKDLGL